MITKILQDLQHWFQDFNLSREYAYIMAQCTFAAITVFIAFVSDIVSKRILIQVIFQVAKQSNTKFDDILYENRVFHRVAHIVPLLILYGGAHLLFIDQAEALKIAEKVIDSLLTIVIARAVLSFLTAVQSFLRTSEQFHDKPIPAYIQLVKILVYIITVILILSFIIDKSPFYFLTGIGALSAIILLVFKDTILGLVASIQMTADDIVRVGDWITIDKYGADGDVILISLNTVKVQNFDNTITSIPTYAFISDSFINWRGMVEAGARRVRRQILISPSCVHFLTQAEIESLQNIALIRDYIIQKEEEVSAYNAQLGYAADAHPVNGRRQTNLGVFRKYIELYLRNHPNVHQNMNLAARHRQPTIEGIPIEIYCFLNVIEFFEHERVQGDIFDHIFAIAPYFNIEIQESVGSNDLRKLSAVLAGQNIQLDFQKPTEG